MKDPKDPGTADAFGALMDEALSKNVDIDQSKLEELAKLVNRLAEIQDRLMEIDKEVKGLSNEHKRIQCETIPSIMVDELGFEEIKLADGRKLSVKLNYYASIAKARQKAAFAWLEANGFGDLIKAEVKTKFGAGERDKVKTLEHLLSEMNYNFTSGESVHPQTLKAFVREQMEAGNPLPEAISVHVVREAKLK